MATTKEEVRRQRLERVLRPLLSHFSVSAQELKEICAEESPAFVTRVLRRLAQDGMVVLDEESGTVTWQAEADDSTADAWIDRQVRGVQMTQTPPTERPRERLLHGGAENLRSAELLAILIRSGRPGESALQMGERIANRFGDNLMALTQLSFTELKRLVPSISVPAFCQIMAGIELGRRTETARQATIKQKPRLTSSLAATEYCRTVFARLAEDRRHEEFHIVTLDTKKQPIDHHQISRGTLDASLVHPREVFRPAIRDAASAILIVHNHPSGDPTPSPEDFQVMRALSEAGDVIGIPVVDSVIVAGHQCISMRDRSNT